MQKNISWRSLDFFLLGGASLFVWAALVVGDPFRLSFPFVGARFAQLGTTFAVLSLVCNHPHFVASYKMAYSRGWKFCRMNLFSLFVVPTLLFGGFAIAYVSMETPSFNESWTRPFNAIFSFLGLSFRFGNAGSLGMEILLASIWLMYLTVGWHYAKQAFGCMMVYANYDRYPLTQMQRRLTKYTLFSVAIYNFAMLGSHSGAYFPESTALQFSGVDVLDLGLSTWGVSVAGLLLAALLLIFLVIVVGRTYQAHRKVPSANFVVPLLAFLVWWIPAVPQREFYFFMVPFFHSLQYLAFAARVEHKSIRDFADWKLGLRLGIVFAAGVFFFEALPDLLTTSMRPQFASAASFFPVAVLIFINVHHYFLDSVIWKFQSPEVKNAILSTEDPRRLQANQSHALLPTPPRHREKFFVPRNERN